MSFWQAIDKPVIGLSPMDGVTDASFRFITAKYGGPDVTLTEFVNVAAAFYSPYTLIRDLTYSETERPVVAQIYGNTPEMFYKVAHIVCELGFDGLDINMGCPAKKVAAAGCGAALIVNPKMARSIIRAAGQGIQDWFDGQTLADLKLSSELIEGVRNSNQARTGLHAPDRRCRIPLSVKTRLGYDRVIVEDWIKTLLEEKLTVISLHGRTLKQGYKGDADWGAIARAAAIAKDSGTLILGNGDLQGMNDIYRRVRESNVDGVLLGRSAQGNPWIFHAKDQVKQAVRFNGAANVHPAAIGFEERFRVMLEHSQRFEKHSMSKSFVAMRKHLVWYCTGFRGAAELRSQLVRVNDANEVAECLSHFAASAASRFPAADRALPENAMQPGAPGLLADPSY